MPTTRPLVLFDIDGTLLSRAGPHHKAALIEGVRAATGVHTTLDGIDTAGMLDRDLIRIMLRNAGASERMVSRSLQAAMDACQSYYSLNCASDLRDRVCVGIPECLERLQESGAVLGVVSGNLTRIGWKKLELAGLRSFFSFGAFAEDGRTRARLGQVASWRARREHVVRRVSLVGDHLNDVEAARRNGFQSVAVATGVLTLDELAAAEPDILVRNATELDINRLL